MENIVKSFYLVAGVFLVTIAISLLYYKTNLFEHFLKNQNKLFQEQVLYESTNDNDEKKDIMIVSCEEVIASLLNELEYPIKVRNTIFSPDTVEKENINYADILIKKTYKKTYDFDKNGRILQINYE